MKNLRIFNDYYKYFPYNTTLPLIYSLIQIKYILLNIKLMINNYKYMYKLE